jgi:rhodanese-related sulfurtransferase
MTENMQHLIRQSDLIPANTLARKIHIIGAGAIGSHVSIALAKMGFLNQKVWDFDEVSVENMSSQGYRFKDIGKLKVDALKEMVHDYSNQYIDVSPIRYTGEKLDGIVVSAVDSMAARKIVWQSINNCQLVDYLIDPRMSAEYAVMYIIDPKVQKDITAYDNTLFDDSAGTQERCTAKATMYCASMISALVCKGIKDIVNKDRYPRVTNYNVLDDSMQTWRSDGTSSVQC